MSLKVSEPFGSAVNAKLLERHIEELGSIGVRAEGGLYRGVYTKPWADAMRLVNSWMGEAGLETRSDPVGNLFGRLTGTGDSDGVVLTGSHIDTVIGGGKYDGALGIHSAIAAIELLKREFGMPLRHLEVYVACEEEGSRFQGNLWGTRALVGKTDPAEVERLRDDAGISIAEAMTGQGLDPTKILLAKRNDILAFVELHIEQGPTLNERGYDVGIVSSIVGGRNIEVSICGRADHAGTTPMRSRRDALIGAAEIILGVNTAALDIGDPGVATVGTLALRPGSVNVVPEACTFTIDTRHADTQKREQLLQAIYECIDSVATSRGLDVQVRTLADHDPVAMSGELISLLSRSATAERVTFTSIVSGAGHDSDRMAKHFPTAMIFVPSAEGGSHNPNEFTPLHQIFPGVGVLARALYELAY